METPTTYTDLNIFAVLKFIDDRGEKLSDDERLIFLTELIGETAIKRHELALKIKREKIDKANPGT